MGKKAKRGARQGSGAPRKAYYGGRRRTASVAVKGRAKHPGQPHNKQIGSR